MTCKLCGAPAAVAWESLAEGVNFGGEDALFALRRIECAAGHWFTDIGEVIETIVDLTKEEPA